jgi:Ca-activated chloride channel homolog
MKFLALISLSLLLATPTRADNPVRVLTEPGEIPQLKIAGGEEQLPLEHTHVSAELTGTAAGVTVTQTYKNTHAQPIEAIYVFPLPENSAVDDMTITIGTRVIRAEIQKRADARRTYEDAKRHGHTAALLEQERPNIFTQWVANLAPNSRIEVTVHYLQTLTYDAGEYEFVFPMVVGPRFSPAAVSDAARLSPPIFGKGARNGHDISMDLIVRPGTPVTKWEVPTHETTGRTLLDGAMALSLAKRDEVPNRDFVLHYMVAGQKPVATAVSERDGTGGFVSLTVQPPKLDVDALVGRREIIFVVDISGSMHGVPLSMCKDAMREALAHLRPVDTFNIYTFSGQTGSAFKTPVPANDTHIKEGTEYVTSLRAGGGTYMADAVDAALGKDVEAGRNRYVFFMTDGYVGNEAQILEKTRAFVKAGRTHGRKAKVFGFGVGSSVNRYLLDGFSTAGEGLTVYSTTREDPVLAVNKFYRAIDNSIMEEVSIDWNGLAVKEVYPRILPDLFASHPLTVHARLEGDGKHTIYMRGKVNGRALSLPIEIELPVTKKDNSTVASLWARAKVSDLERDLWSGERAETVNAITQIGLEHRLVTRYTSFVAVDHSTTLTAPSKTIVQAVHEPEGVDGAMAGAFAEVGLAGLGSGGGGQRAEKGAAIARLRSVQGRGSLQAPASEAPAPKMLARENRSEKDEEKFDDGRFAKKTSALPSIAKVLSASGALTMSAAQSLLASQTNALRAALPHLAGKALKVTVTFDARGTIIKLQATADGAPVGAESLRALRSVVASWSPSSESALSFELAL